MDARSLGDIVILESGVGEELEILPGMVGSGRPRLCPGEDRMDEVTESRWVLPSLLGVSASSGFPDIRGSKYTDAFSEDGAMVDVGSVIVVPSTEDCLCEPEEERSSSVLLREWCCWLAFLNSTGRVGCP